jgi:hypothetical protein
VDNINDVKINANDFITEKKGRFRDFYSFGPQLGTGMNIINSISVNN